MLDVSLGGVVKGSGSFGTVNVGDGGTFSPGNSPGTATAANVSFASGGDLANQSAALSDFNSSLNYQWLLVMPTRSAASTSRSSTSTPAASRTA